MKNEKVLLKSEGVTRVVYKNERQTPSEKYRKKYTQSFDPEKITVTQAGVTYNVYDRIQEYEPSTNFYKILEEYHCTTDEAIERMKGRFNEIQGVVDMGKSYAEHLMDIEKAKTEFEALPVKIKQRFNNNVIDFIENGQNFINEQFRLEIEAKNKINKGEEIDE